MDNYTVGSVADLISQGKSIKSVSKKGNKKSISNKISLVKNEAESIKNNSKGPTVKEKSHELCNSKQNVEKKKAIKRKGSDMDSSHTKLTNKIPKKNISQDCSMQEFSDGNKNAPLRKLNNSKNKILVESSDKNKNETQKKFIRSKKNSVKIKYTDFTENTVFVGNIPISFDKQKVCKVFSKFGKIQSARIRCVPIAEINMSKKLAAVKKKFNPQRNSLVAYVKYESEDAVKAALKANGMVVDGHHIRIDLAKTDKNWDNNKAVFVGGLPFNIEDDELWRFFENCGKINSVRVIRDSQTSMGKGFGYVNFDSAAAVELALQLNGQELKKKAINVQRCLSMKKKNSLTFGKKKSKEITDKLLVKKQQNKKLKAEKKKLKLVKNSSDFQGNKANVKKKNKKKLSKAALQKKKLIKILTSAR